MLCATRFPPLATCLWCPFSARAPPLSSMKVKPAGWGLQGQWREPPIFQGRGAWRGVEVWRSQKESQWDGSPPLNAGSGPRKGRGIGGCGPR